MYELTSSRRQRRERNIRLLPTLGNKAKRRILLEVMAADKVAYETGAAQPSVEDLRLVKNGIKRSFELAYPLTKQLETRYEIAHDCLPYSEN